ncbi:MAG: group 1 glycosyl transferase [Phage 71_18]|nr:MAG: group 1 glycosyl transferase [Phage 71_18]
MILTLSDLWVPFPGGAERLIFNLARDLMRRGEDVEVLTGYEPALQFDGPHVTAAPIGVFNEREQGAAFVTGFIKAARPDLILTHHLYASQFSRELVATGLPIVHVVLNGPRIPEAALGVYISQWVHDTYDPAPGDLILTPPVFDDVVADHHGDMVGFIKPIPHKGVELFYEVAAAMPERRFLVLRGEWQDIEVIQPAENIEFMEPVTDMRTFYERCRLVLMPSTSEDAGTVAQEATANGLPCISSDRGGLVQTNGGGIRLDPFDAGLWVDTIEQLDDPELYRHTVERQQAHLAGTGQDDRLAGLHARIKELIG